ncbi:NUDIX domain-containing protein [Streptococcus cristatus]|uniref:NUDIX domain-containing protein n=1 Tax=Streptococcus cristatus TaxID=45634 RepID=A0A5B0DLY6_STRCR|nr:NUDIX domain-containing protein [Streptococcus cristatus]KAA0967503.1 NUDIX domain-containing protein [Streptococcus cristatus]
MNYIKNIRKKVGHDKIFLNFSAGILQKSGRILLQRRSDKGTWGIPGGAIELGESATEALIREYYEETGIKIKPLKLLNVYTKYTDCYPNGDEAQVITILYEVYSEDIYINMEYKNVETLELKFFNYDEIQELVLVNKQHEDMIKDFFENSCILGR